MNAVPPPDPAHILIQRVLFHYSECRIEPYGLRILEKTPTNQRDYTFRFEDIPVSRFTLVRYRRGLVIWAICCVISLSYLLFALTRQTVTADQLPMLLMLIAITVGSVLLVWFTRREYIGFGTQGNVLLFRANKPSRQAVSAFLDTMLRAKQAFLRATYLRFDPTESAAHILSRLLWLQEQQAITAEEFDTFKNQYVSDHSDRAAAPIGFGSRRA